MVMKGHQLGVPCSLLHENQENLRCLGDTIPYNANRLWWKTFTVTTSH